MRDHSIEEIIVVGGATTSKKPLFHLLPSEGLIRVADRFELGLVKHSKDNWRKGIHEKEFALARLDHVIGHALRLIDKIEGRKEADGDDDAAAITWGGLVLSEYMKDKNK